MPVLISDDYNTMSKAAADLCAKLLQGANSRLVCIASGDTPRGMYQELTARVTRKEQNITGWKFIGLDEWVGMNKSDPGSCGEFLDQYIIQPLQLKPGSYRLFDGRSADLEAECEAAEKFIEPFGQLDLAILGLGMNGHLGLNEPGAPIDKKTYVGELAASTIATGQKYFTGPTPLTRGITLGLGTLLNAKHVFLLVSGEKKAAILKEVMEGPISNKVPGSLLRNHPGFHLIADKAAAGLLDH